MSREHKPKRIVGSHGLYLYRGVRYRRFPGTAQGYWGAWRTVGGSGPVRDVRAGSMKGLLVAIDKALTTTKEEA